MGDIFDDIDEILKDEAESTPASSAASTEEVQSFNESELEDIMSEIENLEKDFDQTDKPKKVVNLQDEVERELQESLAKIEMNEVVDPSPVIHMVHDSVKSSPLPHPTPSSQPVSIEATGSMNLNLSFKVGSESAHLNIDQHTGLKVSLNGVEITINEQDGCVLTMENGMKFTVPLASVHAAVKKSA